MKKELVLNLYDGTTGEVLATIDTDITGFKGAEAIIEYQLEKIVYNNYHDFQIRCGYRP